MNWSTNHPDLLQSVLFQSFLWGLVVATIAILIRSTFRVAELSGGFKGSLANNQPTFMILEGAMVTLACLCLTICHPGLAFRGLWKEADYNVFRAKKTDTEKSTNSATDLGSGE